MTENTTRQFVSSFQVSTPSAQAYLLHYSVTPHFKRLERERYAPDVCFRQIFPNIKIDIV